MSDTGLLKYRAEKKQRLVQNRSDFFTRFSTGGGGDKNFFLFGKVQRGFSGLFPDLRVARKKKRKREKQLDNFCINHCYTAGE